MCNKFLKGTYEMHPLDLLARVAPLAFVQTAIMVYLLEWYDRRTTSAAHPLTTLLRVAAFSLLAELARLTMGLTWVSSLRLQDRAFLRVVQVCGRQRGPVFRLWLRSVCIQPRPLTHGSFPSAPTFRRTNAAHLHARVCAVSRVILCCVHAGFMAWLLNITNFFTNQKTSPVTLTVGGNVKQILTILLSIAIFNTHVSFMGALGILVTVAGAILYSIVNHNKW